MSGRANREAGSFLVAAVVLAPIAWTVAFNLGAYGEVLYEHLFAVWSVSIACLLACLMVREAREDETYFHWWSPVLFAVPTIWFASESLLFHQTEGWASVLRATLTILTVTMALPYILYFVANVAVPELALLRTRRLRHRLVAIVAVVALVGFLSGARNDLVLTCKDFEVAGAQLPANCYRGGP